MMSWACWNMKLHSDFEIDWAEISKPLESSDEIETQAEEQAEVMKEMFNNH